MASGKWLLILFLCWLKRVVTSDGFANQTVESDEEEDMKRNKYMNSLPDNDTDFSLFTEIERILSANGFDSACYYVFFSNSSLMLNNRSAQAKEAGQALRLGWELSKEISADIYCSRQGACEWSFLGDVGQYFRSLDNYITKFYEELLAAIDEARDSLLAGRAPERYKEVCARANLTVLTCETLRIELMFGKNCSNAEIVLPPKCSPRSERNDGWPIGPWIYVFGWKPTCWWPRIPGQFDNIRKILKFARFLASRLLHLTTAQGHCGAGQEEDGLSKALFDSIHDVGVETRKRSKQAYLTTGGPRVIDKVTNDFEGLVWPDSEDDAKQKYDPLKRKIEEAFVTDYLRDVNRAYLIFYTCKEEAFALLKDYSTNGPLIHVRRPDVNVIARIDEVGMCFTVDWPGGIERNTDAIANAYKNANGNAAAYRLQQVDKVFKWRVSDGGCAVAVMAIECAYKFVWQELGWRYFPAWRSDDSNFMSVKVRSESSHNPMCADIIFIK